MSIDVGGILDGLLVRFLASCFPSVLNTRAHRVGSGRSPNEAVTDDASAAEVLIANGIKRFCVHTAQNFFF